MADARPSPSIACCTFVDESSTIGAVEGRFDWISTVIAEISEKRDEIIALCERHGVIRLGVFGSAARGTDFNPEKSDIDFLVLFDGRDRVDYIDRFLDLGDDLEALFGKRVDLVTELSVQSPIFRAAVERDLESIYARPARQTAA